MSHLVQCGSCAAWSNAPSRAVTLCLSLMATAAIVAWEAVGHQWMNLTGLYNSAFTYTFLSLRLLISACLHLLSWPCTWKNAHKTLWLLWIKHSPKDWFKEKRLCSITPEGLITRVKYNPSNAFYFLFCGSYVAFIPTLFSFFLFFSSAVLSWQPRQHLWAHYPVLDHWPLRAELQNAKKQLASLEITLDW